MADGVREHDWAQTASIMCLIANVNRNPKTTKKPYTPQDFMPRFGARAKKKEVRPATPADLEKMKAMFGRRAKR